MGQKGYRWKILAEEETTMGLTELSKQSDGKNYDLPNLKNEMARSVLRVRRPLRRGLRLSQLAVNRKLFFRLFLLPQATVGRRQPIVD